MLVSASGTQPVIFHTGVSVTRGATQPSWVRAAIGVSGDGGRDPQRDVVAGRTAPWPRPFGWTGVLAGDRGTRGGRAGGRPAMNSGASPTPTTWRGRRAYVHSGTRRCGTARQLRDERLPMGELTCHRRDPAREHSAALGHLRCGCRKAAGGRAHRPFVLSMGDRYASKVNPGPQPQLPSTRDLGTVLDGAPGSRYACLARRESVHSGHCWSGLRAVDRSSGTVVA